MSSFLRAYLKFFGIAILMFALAGSIYRLTYQDPLDTQQQVAETVRSFDALYANGADNDEKQKVILTELLRERHKDFWTLMFERLAEALILAGIMIVTVEGLTKFLASKEEVDNTESIVNQLKEQANQISANVWNAIFERLVPEPIAMEVKRILKADVCRIRPQYTIILTNAPYSNLSPGQIVVKRQLYYRLLNLTGGKKSFSITIQVLSHTGNHNLTDHTGSAVSLPRICEVSENGVKVNLTPEQRTAYEHTIELPKMIRDEEAWEIYSEADEVFNLTDRALYVLTLPCYGLELQIINQIPQLVSIQEETVYLTSGRDRLKMTTPQKWVCEGGLLSGTALSLSWKAVPKSS